MRDSDNQKDSEIQLEQWVADAAPILSQDELQSALGELKTRLGKRPGSDPASDSSELPSFSIPNFEIMGLLGRGGSGGDWKKELSTRRDLENEGWVEVATLNEATSDKNKPLVWYIFERQFQGGESLRIRTEKYLAPRIFVPPSN